jgi:hypothetical protein
VEQTALYNQIQTAQPTTYTFYIPGSENKLKTFICPSDPNGGKNLTFGASTTTPNPNQGFHGNYVVCAGNTLFGNNNQGTFLSGMFYVRSQTKLTDVSDGLSNTLMVSEILLSQDKTGHDLRGRYNNSWEGNSWFSTLNPPNTTVGDTSQYCQPIVDAPCTAQSSSNVVQYARSKHTGGVLVCMGDGSGRFVSNTVTPQVWMDAGTRDGKEVPGNF